MLLGHQADDSHCLTYRHQDTQKCCVLDGYVPIFRLKMSQSNILIAVTKYYYDTIVVKNAFYPHFLKCYRHMYTQWPHGQDNRHVSEC